MNTKHTNTNPRSEDPREQDRRDGWDGDARMDQLLDEALDARTLPGGIPHGLSHRVLSATLDRLPRATPASHSVLARIGPGGRTAVAACLTLAVSAAIWFAVQQPLAPVSNPGVVVTDEVRLSREITAVAQYEGPSDTIDREISLLAMNFDRYNLPDSSDAILFSVDESSMDSADPFGGTTF